MLPFIYSLIAAVTLTVASYFTFGFDGIMDRPWIVGFTLMLILVGLVVSFLGELNDCVFCRLSAKFKNIHLFQEICDRRSYMH